MSWWPCSRAATPGEHIRAEGHKLDVGIVAALQCERAPGVPHDSLVCPLVIRFQVGWLSMRWWGVVPMEYLHRQHGPLGCILACVWVITLTIYGDKQNGHLGYHLESPHRAASCAPTIVPAMFKCVVPTVFGPFI